MKVKKPSTLIKIICAVLILGILVTTLYACGLLDAIFGTGHPDDDGTVTTAPPVTTTPPSSDTPGGDTETTYHKVSFAVAVEDYKSRVTLPKEKLYKEGTEIQYLPTPGVKDLLFMGWYYDAAMTRPVEKPTR